jgi:hypothetical protein
MQQRFATSSRGLREYWRGNSRSENIGIVTSLRPIPIPRRMRQANNWGQVCERACSIGASILKRAPMKMQPRRPNRWLSGSDNQQDLLSINQSLVFSPLSVDENERRQGRFSQKQNRNIWHGVDHADDPRIALTCSCCLAHHTGIGNAKCLRK